MKTIPTEIGALHFVGIGGIGMSGIAEVLHALGYVVRGSDIAESPNVQRLRKKGIEVEIGHRAENVIKGLAAVIVSSAIKKDNPEVVEARSRKIPVVRRADMLGELMRLKRSIAIGGTHGKTTTTSLVGAMLEAGNMDPTVINGGIVNAYGTNTRMGSGDWMVVESDESDGSFTRLPATFVAVTNIDAEHMEHYGDFDGVRNAFRQFVENIPFYGYAVLCTDHPEVMALAASLTDRRVYTYGFNPQADVRAMNVRSAPEGSTFDVQFAPRLNGGREKVLRDVFLPMIGQHNVQNALVALTFGQENGIPDALMKKALAEFGGVKRRFTLTGEVDRVRFIDDYGHHPVEIAAVLKAARSAVENTGGRIVAVMQPHRYTRLHSLFEEFCACFNDADTVLIAPVYPAGEEPIEGADAAHLVEGIRNHHHRDVRVLESEDALPAIVNELAQSGDFVIGLGAGSISAWMQTLPEKFEALREKGDAKKAKA